MGTEIIMESLNNNQNLSDDDRILLYEVVRDVAEFISLYKVDINLSNTAQILNNIKIVNVDESESYFNYSQEKNTLSRKKTTDDYQLYDLFNSALRIMSQMYNPNSDEYQSGLLLKDENGIHNTVLNEELISRLTTLITGHSDRKRKDSIDNIDGTCIKDVVIKDMCDIISYQDLIAKFFAADGDGLFDMISEKIGVEQTMDFISIIDESEKEFQDDDHKIKIAKRQKYDRYVTNLKDLNLETIQML